MRDIVHLQNIVETCRFDIAIREDGSQLHCYNRFIDLFTGKQRYEHFEMACKRLEQAAKNGALCQLVSQDQVQILFRFKQVQKKLGKQEVKRSCARRISRVEKAIFQEEAAQKKRAYVDLIQKHLLGHIKREQPSHIHKMLLELKELMQRNRDEHSFICYSLQMVRDLLQNDLFKPSGGLFLSPQKKSALSCFGELFSLCDAHINTLGRKKHVGHKEHALYVELKLQLANLPPPAPREHFPNLHLTESEQRDLLVSALKSKEDEHTDALKATLKTKNPSPKDCLHLSKLLLDGSTLSQENRQKLRDAVKAHHKSAAPKKYSDVKRVQEWLAKGLSKGFSLSSEPLPVIQELWRSSKAKEYFASQTALPEDKVFIPRWYHATHFPTVTEILKSSPQAIQVRRARGYQGAWVSSTREPYFGSHVFVFSQHIAKIDPQATRASRCEDRRWRGLQRPIPLQPETTSHATLLDLHRGQHLGPPPSLYPSPHPGLHLGLLAYPKSRERLASKTNKLAVEALLKKGGFAHNRVKAMSLEQVDFINRQVGKVLGSPNLNSHWWGV